MDDEPEPEGLQLPACRQQGEPEDDLVLEASELVDAPGFSPGDDFASVSKALFQGLRSKAAAFAISGFLASERKRCEELKDELRQASSLARRQNLEIAELREKYGRLSERYQLLLKNITADLLYSSLGVALTVAGIQYMAVGQFKIGAPFCIIGVVLVLWVFVSHYFRTKKAGGGDV